MTRPRSGVTSSLTGTGQLVRLILRRDRVILPSWVLGLTVIVLGTASKLGGLYPDAESRRKLAEGIATNPGIRALYGRAFDLSTVGGIVAWRLSGTIAVIVALMTLFSVVRHTRAEEEAGRRELVGATVVGRHAPLTAALAVSAGASLVLAVLLGAGLTAQGLPAGGSFGYGLAIAGSGVVFAAVAAVTAQLTESSRAANGMAAAVLGLSYLLRAAGDVSTGGRWLVWLSPGGWMEEVRPYTQQRWWPFGLAVAFAAASVVSAYLLVARRDLGAGLVPPRPGPAAASPRLRGPFALAWRLQRGVLIGWVAGYAVLGGVLGSLAKGVGDLLGGNRTLEDMFHRMGGHQGMTDAYLASVMGIMGMVVGLYAVQSTLRLRSEETASRAEPVLATTVGRLRWVASHLAFPVLGTAAVLGAGGLAAGLVHGLRTHDVGHQVPRVLAGALVQLPAAWIGAAVALALFGLAPRRVTVAWGLMTAYLVLGEFGPLLKLSHWVMDVSPYSHIPKIPGGDMRAAPLLWLTGLAAVLAAAGMANFRRRDVG
ncbi:MAG: ABC transporter permease [Mycobacteriales bacterium]